jgi:hypothetical protein
MPNASYPYCWHHGSPARPRLEQVLLELTVVAEEVGVSSANDRRLYASYSNCCITFRFVESLFTICSEARFPLFGLGNVSARFRISGPVPFRQLEVVDPPEGPRRTRVI